MLSNDQANETRYSGLLLGLCAVAARIQSIIQIKHLKQSLLLNKQANHSHSETANYLTNVFSNRTYNNRHCCLNREGACALLS